MGIAKKIPVGNNAGMKALTAYLNRMSRHEQEAFALRCETTVGYLRKAVSKGQLLGEKLCISIDRESKGEVPCEVLRNDVDWGYIRGSASIGSEMRHG